jgi:L-aspartate oxidase
MNPRIDNIVETDGALILGAGIAGLFTALKLAPMPSIVLAGTRPGLSGSSAWAQGGIAASVGEGDSWQSHAHDTMVAGAGLCDPTVVDLVVQDAPARIADLVAYGAPFDRKADGTLALGREAAHTLPRIVHVKGDGAGAAISATLAARAYESDCITLLEGFHAIELAMENGRVTGIFARSGLGCNARLILFRARAVILASGGLGALYAVTTNPLEARGEGLGMAARAGAVIADPEFVQYHPTAMAIGRDPAPLATEALRGEGAVLVNERGERFMTHIHNDAELAPRDIVARAIHRQITSGQKVFLDCRNAIGSEFPHHFPTVYAACMSAGIDPSLQPIPVAPAAHYHMGGIASDVRGRSSLPGLWVVGECASTGLHGANRLASNSLLEGLIFGARVAEDVRGQLAAGAMRGLPPAPQRFASPAPPHVLRNAMSHDVALVRDGEGLRAALGVIRRLETASTEPALLNMTAAAKLVAAGALARKESRGGHWRTDHPQTAKTGSRSFMTLADAERIAAETETAPRRARK